MVKKKIPFAFVVIVAGLILLYYVPKSYSQADPKGYAGVKTCAACHNELTERWQATRHSKALETLRMKSQEKLPACVKCHVTGFDKPGGYVDQELTPELEGVQCEVCHGPAAAHAENPGDRKSLIVDPGEASCRECHTKGQDPNFNYSIKKKLVHGEDQKGTKR